MNQKIRKYLIDQSIAGRPVFYEDVAKQMKLDLGSEQNRYILKKTLGDISVYEYENGRPLVSSMAIYKTKNEHGYGFFDLCEKLGIGKASKLHSDYYGFTEIENSKKFWKDKFNYEQFYELNIPIYNEQDNPFFNLDEIDFFRKWINRVYDPKNKDHFMAKEYLMNTVWQKTQFWSNEVIKRLDNYETSNGRYWSKRGWDNGIQIASFKPYTWARIFKKGHKGKDIFFTLGVDPIANALIYKLDYYHEDDSRITSEQKELCKKHIPKNLKWNEIEEVKMKDWDWESLIKMAVDFISKNSHHYDQVMQLVWGESKEEVFTHNLTLRDFPDGGFTKLPTPNPKFEGFDTDFLKKNKEDKELGDLGEELVLEYEKNKLNEKGMNDFSDKVKIAKDGEGYDIFSFDKNGQEIYIEVKTTKGNEKTPFYLSLNEKLFYQKNQDKYIIYRLFNYNSEKDYADFFLVENLDEQLLFQPTQFKVYLKGK